MAQVKPKRRYDSTGRQAQARRSREAILDAARRQFLDAGYAATTIAAIAAEAGVSVETIYNDPDMAALLRAGNDTREERARNHARFLKQRGYLREGVTVAQATDILWTCTSDELYDLLVVQRGWSLPRYAQFLADFMITALLPPAR
jgi:DNA-binding transcriptional regulator YbjK